MNSQMAWLLAVILGAIFATNANAQTVIDKLRGWLTIEDGSKERLDCYRPARSETKTASCEGGRRLQIPDRRG